MSDEAKASVAVVTGAGRGVGRATALAFAARGLDVALLSHPGAALEDTASEVSRQGVRGVGIACDVAVVGDVERAAARVLSELGVPRVLVNNAGIVRRGHRVESTPLADWDDVVAVNLRGPFLVSRAFLASMRARGEGRFVHVASISSTMGCAENASYAASKWGLVGFAKSLAEELRGSGLVSVALLPGSIDTDMLKGSGFAPAMTAADVASMIVHLALDAPAAIQGSAIEMLGD